MLINLALQKCPLNGHICYKADWNKPGWRTVQMSVGHLLQWHTFRVVPTVLELELTVLLRVLTILALVLATAMTILASEMMVLMELALILMVLALVFVLTLLSPVRMLLALILAVLHWYLLYLHLNQCRLLQLWEEKNTEKARKNLSFWGSL